MSISNQTTAADLKLLARERGIDRYQRISKAELIKSTLENKSYFR